MHHFIYPSQDAYISNKNSEKDLNFGLDEMLALGVSHSYSKELTDSKKFHFGNEFVSGMPFEGFSGKFTGSFFGTAADTSGSIVGGITQFTTSYFYGNVSGSVNGYLGAIPFQMTNYSGGLSGFNGNINSVEINGIVTGSIICGCFSLYTGFLYSARGNVTGYVTGDEVKSGSYFITIDRPFINRSLIKFNLDFISQSIVNGDITNPQFFLKVKSTEARELPTTYKIYAFPIDKSWDQGDGYFSDGGSRSGVSWNYTDFYNGEPWYPYTDTVLTSSVNYIEDYSTSYESFKRGGGTWLNISCSQTFQYQTSDINMNVTPIVNAWLNQSVPNNGFILMFGGETSFSASNSHMFFFSRETNTIYSPQLDVRWDDQVYVTGSYGTGSVTITYYEQGFSGSMLSQSEITGISASGNFNGSAYFNMSPTGEVFGDSVFNVIGNSGNIKGLKIDGFITASASEPNASGSRSVTGSMKSGDFQGSEVFFFYKNSAVTGYLSGSFIGTLLSGHGIQGELPNAHEFTLRAFQNSPASGNILGFQTSSSSPDFAQIKGTAIDGLLQGANVNIYFTGSNCYVTSSFSVTSSVEITSSVLQPVNTNRPFTVIIQDLKKEYSFEDMPRIGVFAREKFPLKTFGKAPQQPVYVTPRYLPTSSYYAIKDNETEEIVMDFDNYTKISCDRIGNYFYLNTTGLSQEKYYKILIKVVDGEKVYTFDSGDLFKVRR